MEKKWGRRKTDNLLFFGTIWMALVGVTALAMNYGLLIPVAKVSTGEKIAILFLLPTLAVVCTFVAFFFLRFGSRE